MSKPFSIYRSSAGSGKTRTLAKEYLKLALQHRGYYFRHVLAVTFTNKSTQEMKDRILFYLNEFANGKRDALADELMQDLKFDANTFQERCQEVQREILHNYSQFSISTIDAFFQRVIRSFTREAGLMGDYRLEVDNDLVLEEVIDDLIDELGSNKELTEWVVEFAKENLENEKAWDVRINLREFADQIFKEEFKAIEDDVIKETNDHNFFRDFKNKLDQSKKNFLDKVSKPAQEALRIFEEMGWDQSEISYGKNSGLLTFFKMFAFEKNLKEFKNPSDRIRSHFSISDKWPGKTTTRAKEINQIAKEKLIPILLKLVDIYDQDFKQAISSELVLSNFYSFGLIADISRKLREYKDQNNLMLLSDAPKFLNGVIQDSDTPFIYEKVGSFYRNFLIDEFQDTSGYQWKNFLPLLTNSLDQGNRSIVVGDVKQAVYRWRGGDLKLLQQEVSKAIGEHRVDVVELDSNYRSASNIVEFNNLLFKNASAIVAQKTNGILPTEAFTDVAQRIVHKNEGIVQIQFIKKETDDDDWKQIALEQIPVQLELLQSKGVRISDIAILVRKNDEGQEIANYLLNYRNSEKANPNCRYDVISNESLRLDGAASVNVLLGAMRYLQNPDDSIARAQLGYEFARLKEPNRQLTEVFTVTNQLFFENNLPPAFGKSKAWLKKLPLFELAETLIEIFNLGEVQGELAYVQAFQDAVLEFYSRERNDLAAFLEWWEENKKKKSLLVSGEVDAIQIVTVHKSKGLQFKYVLIPFCAWDLDHEYYKQPLLWVKSDKPPFQQAGYLPVKYSSKMKESYFGNFYDDEHVRTHLDNLNLLYVACTRAEQGMFIYAPLSSKQHVGRLLYDSIVSSIELQANWNASALQWSKGDITHNDGKRIKETNAIELRTYTSRRWREKLVIKRSSASFFEKLEEDSFAKIRYGLHMHALLSRIRYASEVTEVLDAMIADGLITEAERELVATQIESLLKQPQIKEWFGTDWDVRTEVPILLPTGDENRIDRLMINGKKAIVVDFKTGEHNRRDLQQVQEYVNILRQMNFTDVEGYVLYLRELEIVNATQPKVKSARRKEDKDQLGLGF